MAFKSAFVIMAPDGDPGKHRTVIRTSKSELTSVMVELANVDQAVGVCSELVKKEGIQSIML